MWTRNRKMDRMPLCRVKEVLVTPFLDLVHLFSGFMPRNRRLWVFGSSDGRSFADNPKWLFLYCVKERSDSVRSVWISRNPAIVERLRSAGLPAHRATSLRGLWLSLRAGVYVYNVYPGDVNPWTWRGAVRVNLWHGIPLKKLGDDVEIRGHPIYKRRHGTPLQKLFWRMRTPWLDRRDDLVIGTSDGVSKLFADAFVVSLDNVPVTGYPRNDVLKLETYEPDSQEKPLYCNLKERREAGTRIVAYMPTFRDQTSGSRRLPIDWELLDALLGDRNAILLLKLHMADKIAIPPIRSLANVIDVPSDMDMYPLLRLVDILITDYSSVYFDFLILRRPMIFYAYDLKDYLKRHRSMFFEYESATPGSKAKDFDELLSILEGILEDSSEYSSEWSSEQDRILKMCHSYSDSSSSERVWKEIYERFVVNK